jgi:hypothetical protein
MSGERKGQTWAITAEALMSHEGQPKGMGREGRDGDYGRRYWYRTSGLFRVKEALYP